MRRRLFFLFAILGVCGNAVAAEMITLDSARILVGDILPEASAKTAAVDLGEAPPPGGTRVLERQAIWRKLRESGIDPATLSVPPTVRVKSARVLVMPLEFAERARGLVVKALRPGVTVQHIDVRAPVGMSPSSTLDRIVISPLPRHAGPFRTTAMVEIGRNGKTEQRVAVTLELSISPEGAEPELRRGTRVSLMVAKYNATVSIEAVALKDGNIGETIPFRVERTKKTLRGRIDSPSSASVVSQ